MRNLEWAETSQPDSAHVLLSAEPRYSAAARARYDIELSDTLMIVAVESIPPGKGRGGGVTVHFASSSCLHTSEFAVSKLESTNLSRLAAWHCGC